MTDIVIQPLRFSASYASRYHNCHGSANLAEAIPGFTFTPKPHAKARDQGTALHKVLEHVVNECTDLKFAVRLFRELADVYGKNRSALIKSEKEYIIWWFMMTNEAPALEHRFIAPLVFEGAEGEINTPPIIIRFLADAIEYIADIMEQGGTLQTEVTVQAVWMRTAPNTTIDILIRQGKRLYVIDLKAGTTPVEVLENEQLLYYARSFIELEEEIFLVILQQKNIGEWEVSREYLMEWAERVRVSEQQIMDGDLTLVPGSWCTFCPANPRGRGDKGSPLCPAVIELLYGASDEADADESILKED